MKIIGTRKVQNIITKAAEGLKSDAVEVMPKAPEEIKSAATEVLSKTTEALKLPDGETLRAYCNINPIKESKKIISKSDIFEYLKSIGVINQERYEPLYSALAENGKVSERSFEILKSFQQKRNPILNSARIFEVSKEEGKINYKALNLIDNLMEKPKGISYQDNGFVKTLHLLKDSKGKFNEEMISALEKRIPETKKYVRYSPDSLFAMFKNKEGNFYDDAVSYFSKQVEKQKKFNEIFTDLFKAHEGNGRFDFDNIKLIDEMKNVFPGNKFFKVKDMVMNAPKSERRNIIEMAKSIMSEQNFEEILHNVSELKLEMNEENIAFAKKLVKITGANRDRFDILKKYVQLSPDKLNKENEQLLSDACTQFFENKSFEEALKGSVYKVGANKDKFDYENLKCFLDIKRERGWLADDIISQLSSRFSLEPNNRALKLFTNLYTMKFPPKNGGDQFQMLDPDKLSFITSMLTKANIDNIPQRASYVPALEAIEELTKNNFALKDKEIFERFVTIPAKENFEIIAKLERVNLEEIGISPMDSLIFSHSEEKDILKFKDFLRGYKEENKLESLRIAPNSNMFGRVEIISGNRDFSNTLVYDFANQKPITNIKSQMLSYNTFEKTQRDYAINTETNYVYFKDFEGIEKLKSQTIKHFDDNNNELYREVWRPSAINGNYDIQTVTPDGKINVISKAFYDKNSGNKIVEKHMKSFDGTKTNYRYEADNIGNVISDYKITDKDGKVLMNRSFAFEKIDNNHYKTSKNNVTYDVKLEDSIIKVTNKNTGKVRKLDTQKLLEGGEFNISDVLQRVPGDELFKMAELDLKGIQSLKYYPNAAFCADSEKILLGKEHDTLFTLMHEWGHAKDWMMFKEINEVINNDKALFKIYEEERELFRKNISEIQLDFIKYFIGDHHYLGKNKAVIEGIAETNSILNAVPEDNIHSLRSQYWQQYFPKTIAYLSNLLE